MQCLRIKADSNPGGTSLNSSIPCRNIESNPFRKIFGDQEISNYGVVPNSFFKGVCTLRSSWGILHWGYREGKNSLNKQRSGAHDMTDHHVLNHQTYSSMTNALKCQRSRPFLENMFHSSPWLNILAAITFSKRNFRMWTLVYNFVSSHPHLQVNLMFFPIGEYTWLFLCKTPLIQVSFMALGIFPQNRCIII